jgi:hypothetical protein
MAGAPIGRSGYPDNFPLRRIAILLWIRKKNNN